MLPGAVVMLALNAARYGGALASGYGDTGTLFSVAHVVPNLARYPRWLLETQTPLLVLAVAAPWLVPPHTGRRRFVAVALLSAALIAATYLAYTVFDDWWYVRFLLPALPLLLVCATVVADALVNRLFPAGARYALPLSVALLAGWYLDGAAARHIFALRTIEARFRLAGEWARTSASRDVFITVPESGSVRYHGGRGAVLWDALPPDGLDAALSALRAAGARPLLMLEDEDEPAFRARFGASATGRLDWPPAVEVHTPSRVRVYDPDWRQRYLAGKPLQTRHIRP